MEDTIYGRCVEPDITPGVDEIRGYGERIRDRATDIVTEIYRRGGRIVGVDQELLPYYEQAVREDPLFAYMALVLDTGDFFTDLAPPIGVIGVAGDAALTYMVQRYVERETGQEYDESGYRRLITAGIEGLGGIIPGFPVEMIPTMVLLTMDAYRQVAEYRSGLEVEPIGPENPIVDPIIEGPIPTEG